MLATSHKRLIVFLQRRRLGLHGLPGFLFEDGRAEELGVCELVSTPQFPEIRDGERIEMIFLFMFCYSTNVRRSDGSPK